MSLNLMYCFLQISKTVLHFFQKSFLIYKFSCKCVSLHRDRILEWTSTSFLKFVQIPLTTLLCRAINIHFPLLLVIYSACTATYNPIMFYIPEFSNNKAYFFILEAFLISKYQTEHCIQKEFYTLLLSAIPLDNRKSIQLTVLIL